jgi:hypothetical protein
MIRLVITMPDDADVEKAKTEIAQTLDWVAHDISSLEDYAVVGYDSKKPELCEVLENGSTISVRTRAVNFAAFEIHQECPLCDEDAWSDDPGRQHWCNCHNCGLAWSQNGEVDFSKVKP